MTASTKKNPERLYIFLSVPQMWMNVPFGTTDALLVVKTSQGPISVPALKDMLSFQTGRHVKV